jgi:uncharacterized protein (DUF1330 family)
VSGGKTIGMAFEMTVGLLVADQEAYARYRTEIASLLAAAEGRFRLDLEVARVLRSEAGHDINRLFVLHFPERIAKERFFADPKYLEIRQRLFEKAVRGVTVLAEYDTHS